MNDMKIIPIILLAFLMMACKDDAGKKDAEPTGDKQTSMTYKPGLGEFMTSIQIHHAKLWFAGINENWELADFEIHEIKEIMGDISTFNSERDEVKSINIIHPPIDSVSAAIQQKSIGSFKSAFTLLTNTCNDCHKDTEHGFNVVKIPDQPPFSNQEFKPGK